MKEVPGNLPTSPSPNIDIGVKNNNSIFISIFIKISILYFSTICFYI